MNETLVTVVGNVCTKPVSRVTANGEMVRFRLASSARYYDRTTQSWRDGHTNYLTVFAWRGLAENVASSVSLGDPLVVQGRLKVRQESGVSGTPSMVSVDIEALAVGHDLSRGTAAFRRVARANPGLTAAGVAGGTGVTGGAGLTGGAAAGDEGDEGGMAERAGEPQFERDAGDAGDAAAGVQTGFLPDREPEPAF